MMRALDSEIGVDVQDIHLSLQHLEGSVVLFFRSLLCSLYPKSQKTRRRFTSLYCFDMIEKGSDLRPIRLQTMFRYSRGVRYEKNRGSWNHVVDEHAGLRIWIQSGYF